MANNALPCIVCGRPLKSLFTDNQPKHGVACQTTGNYGSKVYDPIGEQEQYLEFNVCDDCLVQANEAGQVQLVIVTRDVTHTPAKWR